MGNAKVLFLPCLQGCTLTDEVEWLLDDTDPPETIGKKRQRLLEMSKGLFVNTIDDDDLISDDYIKDILEACKTTPTPDCVGFKGVSYKDERVDRVFRISNEFDRWENHPGIYCRCIYHLSPVRRELAIRVGFRPVNFGEDSDYSVRLKPYLKRQVFIDKNLYFYCYRPGVSTCTNIENRTKVLEEKYTSFPEVYTDIKKGEEIASPILPPAGHGYKGRRNHLKFL